MGLLFIQAVTFADIPVMAAYPCLIALIFVVINLIVDLLYFVSIRACVWIALRALTCWHSRLLRQWAPLRRLQSFIPELTAFRRDLHAHPELGFEDFTPPAGFQQQLQVCGSTKFTAGLERPASWRWSMGGAACQPATRAG